MSQSHLNASELFSVKGRVAVVTGGGSGLGSIMARALAVNGASKVFILGRREEPLRQTASQGPAGVIIPVQCDVTSKESLDAAFKTISDQTDYVEVLFANSGINGPRMNPGFSNPDGPPSLEQVRETLYSVPMSDFNNVLNVNTTGAYYTVLAFLPLLEAANKRRSAPQPGSPSPPSAQVIITSSIAAFNRIPAHSVAYNASKAAVDYLTKALSTVLLPYHIRVNGIAPGLYYSEMSSNLFQGAGSGITEGDFPPKLIPLTRAGSEQDFAGAVIWLTSASGGYMNGNIVLTDGGRISSVPNTY